MNKLERITSERGITLLEVLIAMVILSVSLLMLLNMAMVALDGNDWSNKTTVAVQSMQQKMEELRSSKGTYDSGQDTVDDGVIRRWYVTDGGNYLRELYVEVEWNDLAGNYKQNHLRSFVRSDSL